MRPDSQNGENASRRDATGAGYPILLDVSSSPAVVVGGGTVAARKVKGLLDAGAARIRVVSPRFIDSLPAGDRVDRVMESYRPEHLSGAGLVFAATDSPDVNDAVVRDARAARILVCRVDAAREEATRGDFDGMATHRDGPALVAVSTAGASPALAAMVRDDLAKHWDARWSKMARAMQTLRAEILGDGVDMSSSNERAKLFRALASEEGLAALEAGGIGALREMLDKARSARAKVENEAKRGT